MRAHRMFQPSLDFMPVRIAPTAAVAGLVAHMAIAASGPVGQPGTVQPLDSDTPEGGGTSNPIIIGNPQPPTTQPC
jgi:hypothetical protein